VLFLGINLDILSECLKLFALNKRMIDKHHKNIWRSHRTMFS